MCCPTPFRRRGGGTTCSGHGQAILQTCHAVPTLRSRFFYGYRDTVDAIKVSCSTAGVHRLSKRVSRPGIFRSVLPVLEVAPLHHVVTNRQPCGSQDTLRRGHASLAQGIRRCRPGFTQESHQCYHVSVFPGLGVRTKLERRRYEREKAAGKRLCRRTAPLVGFSYHRSPNRYQRQAIPGMVARKV